MPIGLIDDAWGGSACEAWVRRDLLEKDEKYQPLMARWDEDRKERTTLTSQGELTSGSKPTHGKAVNQGRDAGKPAPTPPRQPANPLTGNARPGNIYNGVLKPTIGYGIRGAIWYQGESNAGRAYQYRDLFPLMIKSWRDEWEQGDFPFYWVQLADFMAEKAEPGDSAWAELREAQTMTMSQAAQHGRGGDHRHRRRQRHPPAQQAGRGQAAGPLGAGQGLRRVGPAASQPDSTRAWKNKAARSS